MPNYVTNTRLSGPLPTAAQPDVDFNGVMFSYKVGFVFPAQTGPETPIRPPLHPPASPDNRSGGPAGDAS